MKLTIFGATGATGICLVEQAIAAGHDVTAVVRDPADRRGVVVRPLRGRRSEVLRLASGMNAALARICAGYPDDDLKLIADFLRRAADAGQTAAKELDPS